MNRTAAWVTGILVVIGLGLTSVTLFGLLFFSPSAAVGGMFLGLLYVGAVVTLLRFTPLWPQMNSARVTALWVFVCLAWGGGFAMMPALLVATPLMDAVDGLGWDAATMSFGGAYPEEPGKALGVVLIALMFRGINRPWHVLVTGALVGLGFETVENISYGAVLGMLDANSDVAGLLEIWGLRIFLGPFLHIIWTAIAGWGIGQALFAAGLPIARRILVALGWLAVSFLLHFGWNYQGGEVAAGVTTVVVCLILYPLIFWLMRRGWQAARNDRTYAYTPRAVTSLAQLPAVAVEN